MTLCTFGPPEARKRHWILKFEDTDVGDMHFDDEQEALAAFEKYQESWTCTLFGVVDLVEISGPRSLLRQQEYCPECRGPCLRRPRHGSGMNF